MVHNGTKLEGWHRGSSCGAVSYFKSGRTILKVRQLRCWGGGRGRIGVISHSPPLGQLHPRSLRTYSTLYFSLSLSLPRFKSLFSFEDTVMKYTLFLAKYSPIINPLPLFFLQLPCRFLKGNSTQLSERKFHSVVQGMDRRRGRKDSILILMETVEKIPPLDGCVGIVVWKIA